MVTKSILRAILAGSQGAAFITGTPGLGNLLTANLSPSVGTATTWQWTRNGANISGATSSTYTQQAADLGSIVGVLINGTYLASVVVPVPVSPTANVVSGIAPLAVSFSALGVLDASTASSVVRNNQFAWEFGDPGSGTWSYGKVTGASRNVRYSPWAGHLYETPGTYSATLTVNGAIVQTITITVQDPDVVYAANKTLCVSNGSDFTGAPAGCQTLTTSTINDAVVLAFMASFPSGGYRILWKRGDTFTASSSGYIINFVSQSNIRCGAWGSGAKPIMQNTYASPANSAIFNLGTSYSSSATGVDVVVDGLDLRGVSGNTTGRGAQNFDSNVQAYDPSTFAIVETKGRFVVSNCDMSALGWPIAIAGTGSAAVNNHLSSLAGAATTGIVGIGYGFNAGLTNGFIAGNYIDRSLTGEHGIRGQGAFQCDIYSNYVKNATGSKHLIAVREFAASSPSSACAAQYCAISNNDLDAQTGGSVLLASHLQIAPQNTTSYGLLQAMLIDHNIFRHYDYTGGSGGASTPDILATAQYMVARHNVHEQSAPTVGTGNAMAGIQLQNGAATTPVTLPCNNWFIDHNTVYCGTPLKASYVTCASATHDIDIGNTLAYAPTCIKDGTGNGSQFTIAGIVAGATNITTTRNNSTNTQIKNTDPQWQSAAVSSANGGPPYFPLATADFVLKSGSGSYALTGSTSGGQLGANITDLSAIA